MLHFKVPLQPKNTKEIKVLINCEKKLPFVPLSVLSCLYVCGCMMHLSARSDKNQTHLIYSVANRCMQGLANAQF